MVPCDRCGQHPAVVHITQIVGEDKKELHLCQSCAMQVGKRSAEAFMGGRQQATKACPYCKTTWSGFLKTGLLGCPECYSVFEQELQQVLRRMHGTAEHIAQPDRSEVRGARPAQAAQPAESDEVTRLKRQLKEAVEAEEYEKAAQLRDKIRALAAEEQHGNV